MVVVNVLHFSWCFFFFFFVVFFLLSASSQVAIHSMTQCIVSWKHLAIVLVFSLFLVLFSLSFRSIVQFSSALYYLNIQIYVFITKQIKTNCLSMSISFMRTCVQHPFWLQLLLSISYFFCSFLLKFVSNFLLYFSTVEILCTWMLLAKEG